MDNRELMLSGESLTLPLTALTTWTLLIKPLRDMVPDRAERGQGEQDNRIELLWSEAELVI